MKRRTAFHAIVKAIGYVLLFLAAQTAVSTAAGTLIGIIATLNGVEPNEKMLTEITYGSIYEIMLLSGLLFICFILLIHKRNFFRETCLVKTPPSSAAAGAFLGFGAFAGAAVLISITSAIPAVMESQSTYMEQHEAMQAANPALWAELAYVCIGAPLVEEILCRGLILNTLKKNMTPAMAIFVSAIMFALVHGNLYQVVFTLPLGILLGWLAHRFGSVWPSILAHIAFNFSNYPAQFCLKLGYSETDTVTIFVYMATMLFCMVAIPAGILLVKHACTKKAPPEPVFTPRDPQASPETNFNPPVYTPPYYAPQGGPMAAPEFLIVGLGNPGDKYAQNRHNVGFMALDYIALRENVSINNLRFKALTAECTMAGKKVLLLKPQTFMNLSGEAVREAAAFYKIPPEKILVIFDDINFQPGIFRIRGLGSAGGHNGIKSIISCLGSEAFPRVKLGVGNPPPQWELMNWVLGNPSPEDQKKIIASLEDVYTTAKFFTAGNLDRAAGMFNGKMHE